MASAPASASARAMATASASVVPPSAQSAAEIRTSSALPAGHTSRTARSTSSGNRSLPSRSPPYWSVRRLVSGDRKPESRCPCPYWSSRASKPARSARRAAVTKSRTRASMSARSASRGTGPRSSQARAEAATGCPPPWVAARRPAWVSWTPRQVSLWPWTKSVRRRQAASCSSFHRPGQPGVARPSALTAVMPARTSPAPPMAWVLRWTRSKSPGTPSRAVCRAVGGTTTRLRSSRPPSGKGRNIGGTAEERLTAVVKPSSRTRRLS